MLYVIATPIGNLGDITVRALQQLKECELILCEDTRHSQKLLTHYQIKSPLMSYHKFNESRREEEILQQLRDGKNIGLISDAGTPGIADPGQRLIASCHRESLPVTALPGPCAAITALSLSGFATLPFQFLGFLPRKEGELAAQLAHIAHYPGTTVCYEAPHRLTSLLKSIEATIPQRELCICREISKTFEQVLFGSAEQHLSHFAREAPRGECVLLIAPPSSAEREIADSTLSPLEQMNKLIETFHLSKKEAIKIVSEMCSIEKKKLYHMTKNDYQQSETL